MPELSELRKQATSCTACELYAGATQTVFGAGREGAPIMLAGEQPGDQEDRQGQPFVGPAGKLLDQALQRAGISREDAYVTNVVKHFRFTQRGKRRIHQTPGIEHVRACLPWLRAELQAVDPKLLVTLGATAAKSLLGSSFRLTHHRGELLTWNWPGVPRSASRQLTQGDVNGAAPCGVATVM
jgi:DNA polymerase